LVFFLLFVLPQFSAVLRDFNAKLDPVVGSFLVLSDFLRAHTTEIAVGAAVFVLGCWIVLRRPATRAALVSALSRLPIARPVLNFYRTGLFCRNLGILLGSGVTLTMTLRILVDIMAATGNVAIWTTTADRVAARRQALGGADVDGDPAADGGA